MNPRQRRGMLLLGLSLVGAIAVFLAVSSYVSDVRSQVTPKSTVLRLTEDVPAYHAIPEDAVEEANIPDHWAPKSALRDRARLVGTVTGSELASGSILQQGMLIPQPDLGAGQRELAILVDAETGVAGKITPGAVVDIYATFPGDQQQRPARSKIVVAGARIIDVGETETLAKAKQGVATREEVVPVTFALSVHQSLVLTYAESFAEQVRLALRRPGDARRKISGRRTFQLGGSGQ